MGRPIVASVLLVDVLWMCPAKCINRNEYRNVDELSTFHSFMITAKCKLEKDKEKVSTSELVEFSN